MARAIDPEKRKGDLMIRLKLFTTNLTTYAYAIMGASFIDPYIKGAGFKVGSYVGLALAVAFHALAWYIAPHGEKS
ncbi:MAG: hypothetical protein QM608_03025 [Caulobacter sp.]